MRIVLILVCIVFSTLGFAQSLAITNVPSAIAGGQKITATVTNAWNGPYPATLVMTSDQSCATAPTTLGFSEALQGQSFEIDTAPVSKDTVANLVFKLTTNGASSSISNTIPLTILAPRLTSLNIGASAGGSIHFGQSNTNGTTFITLSSVAPAGGWQISLATNDPAVLTLPSAVTVPEGSTRVSFPYSVASVSSLSVVNLDATSNGQTITESLYVLPSLGAPQGFQAGVYLGGPFTGTQLNTAASGGAQYDYLWLIAQVMPDGDIWVSTYYSDKPNNGSWSTVRGYLQNGASGGNNTNGVCLLEGVIDGEGNIIPNLLQTIGVNNSNGPDPFEFLMGGALTNISPSFDFASLGNTAGSAPLQGTAVFQTGALTLNLATLSGSVSASPGSLALSFGASNSLGSFSLKLVN